MNELKECTKLLLWTLENEPFNQKDILERLERIKQLTEKQTV